MNSRVTSIYITAMFLAVNAQNTVLPVFEMERNMFYRHKAALMYDQVSTFDRQIVSLLLMMLMMLLSLQIIWKSAINLAFFLCEVPCKNSF